MTKPIISFIVLILSIGFTFFYVVPAYNLNKERRGNIESLSNILSTSGEIKKLINETKTNLSSIEPDGLSRFEVFLPVTIDPIRFANNIQNIGRRNRIVLSDIKVEGPANSSQNNGASSAPGVAQGAYTMNPATPGEVSSKKYATTKASFTFTATYEMFLLFLNSLEKSLGVIDLTSLSFSVLPNDASLKTLRAPASPIYQYTMAIETYSLK